MSEPQSRAAFPGVSNRPSRRTRAAGPAPQPGLPVLVAGPTPRRNCPNELRAEDGASRSRNGLGAIQCAAQTGCSRHPLLTTWSKLDTNWPWRDDRHIARRGKAERSAAGLSDDPLRRHYTTNVPMEDLIDGKAMVATTTKGARFAGAWRPRGCWCPHLYFLERAPKWARSLQFHAQDEPGFWESVATICTAIRGRAALCRD